MEGIGLENCDRIEGSEVEAGEGTPMLGGAAEYTHF